MRMPQPVKPVAFRLRKPTFGSDKDRPGSVYHGKSAPGARFGLITEHDVAGTVPCIQHCTHSAHFPDLRDKGCAALFGRLDRMRLQPVALDPAGIREVGLYGYKARHAHLNRLFNDKICARLFDRRKKQPQIGRHLLRAGLLENQQSAVPFPRLRDLCQPLAVRAVKNQYMRADTKTHNTKQIVRLLTRQRKRLRLPQRVLYIKPDFC